MSEFSLTSVLHFLTSKFINDMANIEKKSGFISIFANHLQQCDLISNVSFCHTHETFLYMTLNINTENHSKAALDIQYLL